MHKIFPLLTACFIVVSGCASARSGAELAAVFDTGVAAYDAGRYAEAYKIWDGIRTEDLAAMRNVAMMLRKGQGVARNPGKAEQIYEIAAEAGMPTAQADLADMLLKGEAGKPDPQRALPLLQAAAAANHPVAQFELGQMYEAGALVPRNIAVAKQLYAGAASRGVKAAADRLAVLGPPAVPAPPPLPPPTPAMATPALAPPPPAVTP